MKIKKLISPIIYILIIIGVAIIFDPLTDRLAELLQHQPTVITPSSNNYFRNKNFKFVRQSEDFIPYSKQDLKNIFFSVLNNGWTRFTFHCPREYTNCIRDIETLSNDPSTLTHINNFVHPFNSFHRINISFSESGEVTIEIERLYQTDTINKVNIKVDELIEEHITDDMNIRDKILAIHDVIINNAFYDLNHETSEFKSNKAYGPLLQGYGICTGFTDAMAIFLNRFNVPNFRIASGDHIWNAVYLDGEWLHLDVTWNSPIDESNPTNQVLIHTFFLINTDELKQHAITNHDFNPLIYQEFLN